MYCLGDIVHHTHGSVNPSTDQPHHKATNRITNIPNLKNIRGMDYTTCDPSTNQPHHTAASLVATIPDLKNIRGMDYTNDMQMDF